MSKEEKQLEEQKQNAVGTYAPENARGFENEDEGDVLLPRLKLIQDLSPERKDKIADSGDIVNSLSKEKVVDNKFVPIFKYTNNIKWRDRSEGGGMMCRSMDGKTGISMTTNETFKCEECGQYKFDNSKEGKDAQPKCTRYINFLGFLSGERFPIVASFCRTYINEGKRLYSLAKFSMQDMWNNAYEIKSKKTSKNDNEWFVLTVAPAGKTAEEERQFGEQLYTMFAGKEIKADLEDSTEDLDSSIDIDDDVASEI